MIVGKLLEKALKGIYFDYKNESGKIVKVYPQFWYGDQHELNRWVAKMTKENALKYPLVYYVTGSKVVKDGEWYRTNARLVVMTNTQYNPLNKERTEDIYISKIYPTLEAVQNRFKSSLSVNLHGDLKDKYAFIDEPLWGISRDDFKKYQGAKEGVTLDIVDASYWDVKIEVRDC